MKPVQKSNSSKDMHQEHFSTDHFEKVCLYVASFPSQSVEIESYTISLVQAENTDRLIFKKEGFSVGFVSKETGVVALAKGPDNGKNRNVIETVFHALLHRISQSI